MVCYSPNSAIQDYPGAQPRLFKNNTKYTHELYKHLPGYMRLPCSRCIGCRLKYAQDWAVRCSYESQLHDKNCFITLTFAPEHMPSDGSISVRDVQLFLKRLRKELLVPIRFFACGEYGEELGRPHYHLIIFGYDFPDKEPLFTDKIGHTHYRSPLLEKVWPFGHATVTGFSFQTAAYVARYMTKKINGGLAEKHYEKVDETTGEIYSIKPEFATMSRRPGIGSDWYEKFKTDVFPSDECVIEGKVYSVPRFFLERLKKESPEMAEVIRDKRLETINNKEQDNTFERLIEREKVAQHNLHLFLRRRIEK